MSVGINQFLSYGYGGPLLATSSSKKSLPLEEKTSSVFVETPKASSANKAYKYGEKKPSRQVFTHKKNLTPSVQSNCSAKTPLVPEVVIQHAYVRIQLFYVEAVARQGSGIRSDGSKQEGLNVSVSHARKQGSKGSNGNQAAHANAVSGLTDNMREIFCSQIKNEKQVTPKKRSIILHAARNCTEKDLELLASTDDVESLFNNIWPKRNVQESLLENSRFHNIANMTHEFPAALNQLCDCPLEHAIRPDVAELVRNVMFNELSPHAATQEYVNMILVHFDNVIPEIRTSIASIETYSTELAKAFLPDNFDTLTELTLQGFEDILMTLKDPNQIQTPIANWLPSTEAFTTNFKFIGRASNLLKNGTSKEEFSSWLIKNLPKAQKEISKILSLTNDILNYNEWEKKGSCLPEFNMLSGTYSKAKKTHVMLSPASSKDFQTSLFRTQTPVKKPKKSPVALFPE